MVRRDGEDKAVMGFGEAIRVTKGVDYAAEVEGVRKVAAEAEAVK